MADALRATVSRSNTNDDDHDHELLSDAKDALHTIVVNRACPPSKPHFRGLLQLIRPNCSRAQIRFFAFNISLEFQPTLGPLKTFGREGPTSAFEYIRRLFFGMKYSIYPCGRINNSHSLCAEGPLVNWPKSIQMLSRSGA